MCNQPCESGLDPKSTQWKIGDENCNVMGMQESCLDIKTFI